MKIKKYITNRKNLIQIRKSIEKGESQMCEFVNKKAIFVHIPKCAGVSVNQAIFGNLGGSHRTLNDYRKIFGRKKFNEFFKFTIVRNPWDRLVSAFHFLKKGGMNWADKEWAENNISDYDDFEVFVKEWLNSKNIWDYHHFRPQYHYITLNKKNIAVDFVGHLENISEDFKTITDKLDICAELPKKNTGKRDNFKTYYTEETRNIVSEIYKKDIELLAYDF